MKKKLVIILFGPPGAGKGAQALLLSEKLNLCHIETSKIIEENIVRAGKKDFVIVKGEKYFLHKEKELWKTGLLCSSALVAFWLENKVKKLAELAENFLIEGSPRSLVEAKELIPVLKNLYGKENIKIIFLEVSPQTTLFRNSHRKICSLSRHSILYSEETKNLQYCPLDGSRLIKRKGLDDPETIKIRIKEYKKRTLPLIRYFKEQGLKVEKINGENSPANVFQDILEKLKKQI
ncbi:nucleoside monophosphate kinase [Patescibacteria group bacterium]|nr:nucleoside monophosphate kinase [Patescibacteria group bacterium]